MSDDPLVVGKSKRTVFKANGLSRPNKRLDERHFRINTDGVFEALVQSLTALQLTSIPGWRRVGVATRIQFLKTSHIEIKSNKFNLYYEGWPTEN